MDAASLLDGPEALADALEAVGWGRPEAQGPHLLVQVEDQGRSLAVVVHWPADVAVLELMVGLPGEVVEARRAAVCEAVARLNQGLAFPAFGVDLDAGRAHLRLVIPRAPDGTLLLGEVVRMLSTAARLAADHGPSLVAVIRGTRAPADVLSGGA